MREVKSKQIGKRGFTYTVSQFGAREGSRVLVRLMKILGSIAGAGLQQVDKKSLATGSDGNVTLSLAAIGHAITDFADKIGEDDFDWLCEKFIPTTEVSGGTYKQGIPLATDGVFDLHFAGQYAEMGQWLLFAIEVNYASFLPEGGIEAMVRKTVLPGSQEEKPSPSISPNISNQSGTSGE